MIVVVEGPSAAGKTTWCRTHASAWIPEPEPGPLDEVLRAQRVRWRAAVHADGRGAVIVLDGDPLKLWYTHAERVLGEIGDAAWQAAIDDARRDLGNGDLGFADLVLYADPGVDELRRRKDGDGSRTRRNFERHTAMAPSFRRWYEALADADAARGDPTRVIWEHPVTGLDGVVHGASATARRDRSDPDLLDAVLARLDADDPPAGSG